MLAGTRCRRRDRRADRSCIAVGFRRMITNKHMHLLAEYLARWCQSEIASRSTLAPCDDNQHRNNYRDGNPEMSGDKHGKHNKRAG